MGGLALAVACLALLLSAVALFRQARGGGRREETLARRQADELLYAAWLAEIEARGQELLARLEDAANGSRIGTSRPEAPEPYETEPIRGTIPTPGPEVNDAKVVAPAPGTDVRSRVRALASAGHSPADIARRLHMAAGEVEAILGMEKGADR